MSVDPTKVSALVQALKDVFENKQVNKKNDISGDDNTAAITYVYKNSTSTATTYAWAGVMNNNSYTNSSTNASANNSMLRFKGNGKTLAYYVGNRGSTTRGLARSTKFAYLVLYSS